MTEDQENNVEDSEKINDQQLRGKVNETCKAIGEEIV